MGEKATMEVQPETDFHTDTSCDAECPEDLINLCCKNDINIK